MRVRLAADSLPSSSKVLTNTDRIKELVELEKTKKKRLSAGAMKRLQNGKLADVQFVHQEGDSSAVKKKVTIQQLNSIIFGDF